MEEEIIGPQLKVLPWIEPHLKPKRSELTLFVSATLKVWDGIMKKGKLSTIIGPMTPMFYNPKFPLAMMSRHFLKWNRLEDTRLVQVLENGKIPTLREMGEGNEKKWLQYQQLQAFIEPKIVRINRPLTRFEKLLLGEQVPIKKLSKIYDEFIPSSPLKELTSIRIWEEVMGRPLLEEEWERVFEIIHRGTIANKYQERNYKIVMRWYRCPVTLISINKGNTDLCWRCKVENGTYMVRMSSGERILEEDIRDLL